MTADNCKALRTALLRGPAANEANAEQLFPKAANIAAHLLDDLARQSAVGAQTGHTESEIMRTKFLLKSLQERPLYSAKLLATGLSGQFKPSGSGWLKGTNPVLTVTIKPLGPGIDDPEEYAVT